jgi:hypothetical protein
MPRALRRAMAIEAPVVLSKTKWLCRPGWIDTRESRDARIEFTDTEAWYRAPDYKTAKVFGTHEGDTRRMTRDDAFAALTDELRKRKDVVLLEDE